MTSEIKVSDESDGVAESAMLPVVRHSDAIYSTRNQWTPRLLVAATLLVLITIFIAQNYETVEVRLLFWSINMRLAWTVLLAIAVGAIAGWLVPRLRR